jgi:steroid delta-isomerase-like uncharacterized protein
MTRHDVLDLIVRWQNAAAGRDVATYAACYSDTAQIHSPMAGAVTGREGAVKVFTAFFSAFPDGVFVWEEPIIDGPRIAAVAGVSGTSVGEFMGLPPSGKAFRVSMVFLLDVQDGLIVRDRRNYDFTGWLIQVGVLRAKPA